jgi:hypothetical protein
MDLLQCLFHEHSNPHTYSLNILHTSYKATAKTCFYFFRVGSFVLQILQCDAVT